MDKPRAAGVRRCPGRKDTVEEVLEALVQGPLAATGKPISDLTREEKIGVIAHLESKGAFLIRYSVDRVAELLNLSKYTIYNYLDEIKARRSRSETTAARTARKKLSFLGR